MKTFIPVTRNPMQAVLISGTKHHKRKNTHTHNPLDLLKYPHTPFTGRCCRRELLLDGKKCVCVCVCLSTSVSKRQGAGVCFRCLQPTQTHLLHSDMAKGRLCHVPAT